MASPILVTGGTGTLGRLLVPHLHAAGRSVRVLSRAHHDDTAGIEFVTGDLATGVGLDAAVASVATIVHCASSFKGDVQATRHLVRAALAGGMRPHLVFVSIVGIDSAPITGLARGAFGYLVSKLDAERVITGCGLPWTILRATQFYDLLLPAGGLAKLPLVPVPAGLRFQPIDPAEVAERLATLALGAPAGRAADIGGPRAATFAELIRTYLRVVGRPRPLVQIPVPGKFARAIRQGALLVPSDLASDGAPGRKTWEEFVTERTR